jgi:hypothetical protein
MQVSVKKPGTPSELVHHGVKGMKWGVHRQSKRAFKSEHPTAKSRMDAIHRARAANNERRRKFEAERDPVKRNQLKAEFLNHPDHVTALRLTRGEKFLAVGLGLTMAPTIPLAVDIGATVAVRRSREKRQAQSNS